MCCILDPWLYRYMVVNMVVFYFERVKLTFSAFLRFSNEICCFSQLFRCFPLKNLKKAEKGIFIDFGSFLPIKATSDYLFPVNRL